MNTDKSAVADDSLFSFSTMPRRGRGARRGRGGRGGGRGRGRGGRGGAAAAPVQAAASSSEDKQKKRKAMEVTAVDQAARDALVLKLEVSGGRIDVCGAALAKEFNVQAAPMDFEAADAKAQAEQKVRKAEAAAAAMDVKDSGGSLDPSDHKSSSKMQVDVAVPTPAGAHLPTVRGENGMLALATTGSRLLDLFFGCMLRKAEVARIRDAMEVSWRESAKETVQILMHARDCRGGKGERAVVLDALMWLRQFKPRTYLRNLPRFVNLGYYKDLVLLASVVVLKNLPKLGNTDIVELELLAETLKRDFQAYVTWKQLQPAAVSSAAAAPPGGAAPMDTDESKAPAKTKQLKLTLAAKWAPTEKTSFDKMAKLGLRVAKLLFPGDATAQKKYRLVLTTLRRQLKVVESLICTDHWDQVSFPAVPSKAHKRLKAAFERHEPERYAAYLEALKTGKTKVNTTGLHPHEILKPYQSAQQEDPLIEAQWKTLVDKIKAAGSLNKALAVCDVSGSMQGEPMEVCLALGLIVAEMQAPPFKDHVLTFHETPTWFQLPEDASIHVRYQALMQAPWGGSTNLLKTFELILSTAVANQVPADEMPGTLFIFSDMQFDVAVRNTGDKTAFGHMQEMFSKAGYTLPQVVFWNLRAVQGAQSFPVASNENGVALISGFSADLLKLFLESPTQLTPLTMMLKAISKYHVDIDPSEV